MNLKSLAVSLLTIAAMPLWAALDKVAVIQVADMPTLSKAIAKVGEMSGNPMLGMMAGAALAGAPGVNELGTGRIGEPMSAVVYLDASKLGAKPEDAFERVEACILYPVARTKAQIAAQPGAAEKDGLVVLKESKSGKTSYIAFSEDGQWAAIGADASLVKRTLADRKDATRKLKNEVIKLRVTPKGMAVIKKTAETAASNKAQKPEEAERAKRTLKQLKDIAAVGLSLGVSDRGIDVSGTVRPVKDSELMKTGDKVLIGRPLENAPKNAVLAEVSMVKDDNDLSAALIELLGQWGITAEKVAFPQGEAFVLKGCEPKGSPAERFAATLPELKKKSLISASVCSLYAALKGSVPPLVAKLPEEQRQSIEMMLSMTPEVGDSAIATASWREKDSLCFKMRIAAGELNCITLAMSVMPQLKASKKTK